MSGRNAFGHGLIHFSCRWRWFGGETSRCHRTHHTRQYSDNSRWGQGSMASHWFFQNLPAAPLAEGSLHRNARLFFLFFGRRTYFKPQVKIFQTLLHNVRLMAEKSRGGPLCRRMIFKGNSMSKGEGADKIVTQFEEKWTFGRNESSKIQLAR